MNLVQQLNPQWEDEKVFQESRRSVGAQIQHALGANAEGPATHAGSPRAKRRSCERYAPISTLMHKYNGRTAFWLIDIAHSVVVSRYTWFAQCFAPRLPRLPLHAE